MPTTTTLSRISRLSALVLGLTFLVLRFWSNGQHWKDVFQNLPRPLKVLLLGQKRILQRILFSLKNNITQNTAVASANSVDDGDGPPMNQSAQESYEDMNNNENENELARIRDNQSLIQKVLLYWFGQYEPDEAQKILWMIASSSTDLREKVDQEISDEFAPLLRELACAADETTKTEIIKSKSRWYQWCVQDQDIYGYQGKLAAIIVLDQFSRHVHRYHANHKKNDGNHSLPPQSTLDTLAFRTTQLLTKHHEQEISCGMIPLPQYIFGLMPYRHASTLETVQYVQNRVEQAAGRNIQLEAMTSRFRKATNRRMAVLQDEARRKGKATVAKNSTSDSNNVETGGEDLSVPLQVVDENDESNNKTVADFTDEDILETFPFDADFSDAPTHTVVKTMKAFLAERGIHPTVITQEDSKSKSNKKQKGSNKQQQKQKQKQPKKHQPRSNSNDNTETHSDPNTPCSVIVSLSGGVDSMVIASILTYLKSKGGYTNLDIHAIHIDYANRPESKTESNYVQHYCQRLNIAFHVRRIEEVTRGVTARDEYEQMSRRVRYDLYRRVAQECRDKNKTQQAVVGVMLGHHRGDLRENVLSNAHKGCGPLDLSGMTSVSENDGVTIYRPLLPLEKTEVFDYAHQYGVPYFKDTTPHWSTRGKLRNKLLPLLEEIYGEGSMNNLSVLAVESDECRALLHNTLLKPFMDTVVRKPMGIMFETAPFAKQARGLFFWKFVLREVLHSCGLGMFSDKSVVSFLERIRPEHTYKKTIRAGWLQCRKDYAVYLQEDGKVFVLYPSSFPWRKSDAYDCSGTILELSGQVNNVKTAVVGPWTVSAVVKKFCHFSDDEKEASVKQKAVPSMDSFMEGFIEYYLEVPTKPKDETKNEKDESDYSPMSLVFVDSFKKQTRPPAWKNSDEKIQETLPLLGNTNDSSQALKEKGSLTQSMEMNGSVLSVYTPLALVRVTLDRRRKQE